MIAVDTNILVYSHRRESEWYAAASRVIAGRAESREIWAIPWPCIHEFLATVTNSRIFRESATPMQHALAQVEIWMESPSLRMLGELPDHWRQLKAMLNAGRVAGAMVHDARIAAICREHGVQEFWTADRDFSRMPGLRLRNPLIS